MRLHGKRTTRTRGDVLLYSGVRIALPAEPAASRDRVWLVWHRPYASVGVAATGVVGGLDVVAVVLGNGVKSMCILSSCTPSMIVGAEGVGQGLG